MRVGHQLGAITLMMTSILLSLALMLFIGMYKTTFYEIKRAQNEITSRKSFWLAEGGVECAIAQYFPSQKIPASIQVCDDTLSVTTKLWSDSITGDVVASATSGNQTISRRFALATSKLKSGAIQTSASIKIKSSLVINTPDPGMEEDEGWECAAFRFKGHLSVKGSLINRGLSDGPVPSEEFMSHKKCLQEHLTTVVGDCSSSSDPKCFANDFVQDDQLSVFEDFFGVPRHQHDAVRTNGMFREINLETQTAEGLWERKNCGEEILQQLRQNNLHLWINGSCVISDDYLADIKVLSEASDGITLLVHEGIFAMQGAASIKGVLFHFNQDFEPSIEQWQQLGISDSITTHFPEDQSLAAYYQDGSFMITGGAFFDYSNVEHLALFRDSLSFQYNHDVITHSSSSSSSYLWKKGAWRDF